MNAYLPALVAPHARRLNLDPNAALAVAQVEAGPYGAIIEGVPVMRLELHVLWKEWPDDAKGVLDAWSQVDGPKPWQGHRVRIPIDNVPPGAKTTTHAAPTAQTWMVMHEGGLQVAQATERAAFGHLRMLGEVAGARGSREALYRSASWGMFQILGKNHLAAGFGTAEAMCEVFGTLEGQVRGFFNFIESTPGALDALRQLNWREFARIYNGPGNVNDYAPKMANAYITLENAA